MLSFKENEMKPTEFSGALTVRTSQRNGRPRSADFLESVFGRRHPGPRQKAEFCARLSVLLQARISLFQALELLERQESHRPMRTVLGRLSRDLAAGKSFAQGLSAQPEVFDPLFIVTVEIGEESGRLAEVLTHLSTYLEKVSALKRKVTQALSYPVLVMGVAALSVAFLLLFIVPAFAEMFGSFQIELPASTRLVLGLSALVTSYGWAVVPIVIVGYVLARLGSRATHIRQLAAALALRLPLIGDILLKNSVARFCRTLGSLLKADVTLIEALKVAQRIVFIEELRVEIRRIIQHVRQGRAVAEPLIGSKFFPAMVAQMIAVGEETSKLDEMLLRVAEYYEKELDASIDALSTLVEPIIILLLGLIVAAILVSMYMPMFDLVNMVGGM